VQRKGWVELHRPLVKAHGLLQIVCTGGSAHFKSQSPEVRVVSLCIVGRLNRQGALLAASKLSLQRLGYCFGDLALDTEDVGELAVVSFGPKMCVCQRVHQLHIYAHLICSLLYAASKNICDTELFCDFA